MRVEGARTDAESTTQQLDSQGITYLSYLLYPLLVAGAVYSLLYTPHRRFVYASTVPFILRVLFLLYITPYQGFVYTHTNVCLFIFCLSLLYTAHLIISGLFTNEKTLPFSQVANNP